VVVFLPLVFPLKTDERSPLGRALYPFFTLEFAGPFLYNLILFCCLRVFFFPATIPCSVEAPVPSPPTGRGVLTFGSLLIALPKRVLVLGTRSIPKTCSLVNSLAALFLVTSSRMQGSVSFPCPPEIFALFKSRSLNNPVRCCFLHIPPVSFLR